MGAEAVQKVDRRQLLQGLCACSLTGFSFAICGSVVAQSAFKEIHQLKPGEFTWHPERSPDGPVAIVVSLPDQRVHVYRNGIRIAVSTCSTGKPGHQTPTGVFTILEKDKNHHSSTYNNAPMPNMNRLTWNGVALHAGNLPGYPASHGCVRLPVKFSELLFGITHVGTPVILAGSAHDPKEVVHPGLVLGDYAESEFENVQTKLKSKELPWAAHVVRHDAPTAILVSGADRTGVLLVDGKVVETAPVSIQNPGTPLGSHVFILSGPHNGQRGMAWHAIAHEPQAGGTFAPFEEFVLRRIAFAPDMRAKVAERLHPGMTIVTTDLPAHPDTRSGRDFVVMSQDLTS
jgi:hypothetical protein